MKTLRGSIVWHADYEMDIGPHVFPTRKYRLVRDRLIAEGAIAESQILTPTPVTDDDVALVHTDAYLRKINTDTLNPVERATLEVPFSENLRHGMWLCTGGSVLAGREALGAMRAMHLGGGFHHAFADHGEGFCLINDVAVAIRVLQREGAIDNALVIDLDVHHGNGTAAIFAGDPTVFTFSMHQQHNYPAQKPPSDVDVGLPDGIDDDAYLDLLTRHLEEILTNHEFDLAYYLAGADPYQFDQLGGLGLTLEGLRRRDRTVYAALAENKIPVAVTLAGGYALNPDDTVAIHATTARELG